ncbi:MAG TPA: OmpA family protein, partial [Acidobacteriota bacterium]|nr:OmpA family protein [Acidobacteriota bacterium]
MRTGMTNTFLILFLAVQAAAQAPKADRPGFKDPVLFTRIANYYLSSSDSVVEKPFDGFAFPIVTAGKPGRQQVEGHYWIYKYSYDESAGPIPSPLQIIRNYEAAAAKIGGKVMGDAPHFATIMIKRDGKETWAHITPGYGGRQYMLRIIEKQEMQQEVVANAAAFQDGLQQNGHVEVPGIFFDFGKSDIKPESEPALAEVAKLLQGNPSLKVWVVGHTDNVGSAESNLSLSNARAESVVSALTKKLGIAPA